MSEMDVLKKIAEATIGSHIAVHIPAPRSEPLGANEVVGAAKWAIARIEELEGNTWTQENNLKFAMRRIEELEKENERLKKPTPHHVVYDSGWACPSKTAMEVAMDNPPSIEFKKLLRELDWFHRPHHWNRHGGW